MATAGGTSTRRNEPGIYKVNNSDGSVSWRAYVRDDGGKQVSRTFGQRSAYDSNGHELHGLAAAKQWRADVAARKLRPKDHSEPTLARYYAEYFMPEVSAPNGLEAATLDRYRRHFRLYIAPALGAKRLSEITVSDVKKLTTGMRQHGRGQPTVLAVHRLLHRILQGAVDEDRIMVNPAKSRKVWGRKPPKETPREARPLTIDEVKRLADEVPRSCRALVYAMSYLGMRVGEAAFLRVGDLDPAGWLHIRGAIKEVAGELIESSTSTKTDEIRDFPVPDEVLGILRKHISEQTDGGLDSRIFTAPDGGTLRPNNFRKRIFYPACKLAGITPMPRPHDLRHTAASLMAQAGVPEAYAQRVLGHGSARMTRHYTHRYRGEQEVQAAKVNELLRAGEDGVLVTLRPAGAR